MAAGKQFKRFAGQSVNNAAYHNENWDRFFDGNALYDVGFDSLAEAITYIGTSNRKTLYITTKHRLTKSRDIPSNISLKVLDGGKFDLASGVTLTISGSLEAGRYQIFTRAGTGTVSIARPSTVYPEWFGAVGGLAVDDTDEFQFMADAIANSEAATVSLGAEGYLNSGTVAWANMKGLKIVGPGHASGNNELAKVKLTGVGSVGTPKGWTFSNCLFELENLFFEGAGNNSGGTLTYTANNFGITVGTSANDTGGVNFLINKCFFQFFDGAVRVRKTSYVWWINRNYFNWNHRDVEVVGDNDENGIVHGNINGNTFAESEQGIYLDNCSHISIDKNNHWENGVWPPIATYAGYGGNAVYSVYATANTRHIRMSSCQGIRPVQFLFETKDNLEVHSNEFESYYGAYCIKQQNKNAINVRITENTIDAKLNRGNDFSTAVAGIYSDADSVKVGNAIRQCAIGIEQYNFVGVTVGNKLIDPYYSQDGKNHTGDGIAVRYINIIREGIHLGNSVSREDLTIIGNKAIVSTGTSTSDVNIGRDAFANMVEPSSALTGTLSIASTGTAITGSGSAFTTDLASGDTVRVQDDDGYWRHVPLSGAPGSNTSATAQVGLYHCIAREGAISVNAGSASVSGTGTHFSTELVAGQTIRFIDDGGTTRDHTILSIASDIALTLTSNAAAAVSQKPYRLRDSLGCSGTITVSNGATAVLGVGTLFTTELAVGRIITLTDDGGTIRNYTVNTITDNTHMTFTAGAAAAITTKSFGKHPVITGKTFYKFQTVTNFYSSGDNRMRLHGTVIAGSPESVLPSMIGGWALDSTNGVLYLKTSGTGNTGWVALASVAGPTFTGLLKRSSTTGITASTTQSQGQQALTTDINIVSTCANANDVVTLPAAVAGAVIYIRNNGAQTLQIFPASGDAINGAAANTSTTLAAGASVTYRTADTTNWYS